MPSQYFLTYCMSLIYVLVRRSVDFTKTLFKGNIAMAESDKKGMISGMESLLTISGEEFLEVIRMETDGSFKNYRLLVSKIRNNAGLSAYEIAIQNGFVGSVDQWLSSLEGKTAYQIAVELGFAGDEAAFIASLKGDEGEVGKSIYDIAIDTGFVGTEADFLKTLVGKSAYQTWLDQPGNAGKTEAQFIASIKGTKGDTGIQGIQGEDGKSAFEVWQALPGNIGKDETDYMNAIEGDAGASAYEIALDAGFVGTEAQWLVTLQGKSAYQVAVAGGYVGSQAEWLATLKGDNAYQVAVAGGFVGTQAQWLASLVGKSAYQSWKDAGNAGTEAQFLASLEGSDGTNGADGKSAYETWKALPGNAGRTEAEFIASLKGVAGTNGTDGSNGQDGLSAYETWIALPGNTGKTEAEFIASLKGVKGTDGTNGTNGTNGKSAYQVAVDDGFVGSIDLWLESLVGQEGQIGAGVNVIDTVTPEEYADIVTAATSVQGDAYIVDTFLYIYNGTAWVKSNSIQGPEGQGLNYLGEWPTGISLPMDVNYVSGDTYVWRSSLWTLVEAPTRKWVDIGVPGPQGDSAYETYLLLPGNAGKTEAEFIASLKGPRGNDGTNGTDGQDGTNGLKGDDGDSAYEVAVRDGFVGTEVQWLASLKGDQGEQGVPALAFEIKGTLANVGQLPRPGNPAEAYYVVKDLYIWIVDDVVPANSDYQNFGSLNGASAYEIAVEQGFVGTEPQWLASLKGADGVDGTDGTDGTNGTDGRNLQVKGTQTNLAAIQALPTPVDQDAWVALDTGHLHIRVGAAWIDAGPFRGDDGTDGVDGTDGASAYETYKGLPGNSAKTEAEFIASLKGADGTNGTNGTDGRNVTVKGSVANQAALPAGAAEQDAYTTLDTGTLFMWITGAWVNLGVFRGPKGEDGTQGVVGNDGAPGIGIVIKGEVAVIGDLPDPTTLEPGDAYYVVADNKLFQVNDALLYGPGITIVGPKGDDGIQGIQGPAGNSIAIMGSYATAAALIAAHPTAPNGDGYLVGPDLYLYGVNPVGGATEWFNAGPVRGPKGDQGLQGIQGLRGIQGLVGDRGALWLTLPNGVEEPTSGYGREGDWAVSADFNTFYKAPGTGWVQIGRLVAGDVNSPLGSLGKVVRLGTSWVALPVDEVPNLATGKIYARQSKAGSTTEGEWVEVVFPDSFDEAPADAKLYVRTRSVGVQDGSWFELPAGITDLATKDNKQYIRTFEAADSAPKWKEVVIPGGLPEAPTTAGVAFARRGDTTSWVATVTEAPTTAGKTYLRSGQNSNWVEFTDTPADTNLYLRKGDKTWVQYTAPAAGIAEAPNDGKQYVRKSQAWVSFDRYDLPVKAVAAATTTVAVDPAIDQYVDVDNTTAVAKTITLAAGAANRAQTVVMVIRGALGTLTFAATGSTIGWNTGSQPAFTGSKTVLTFLWTGSTATGWIAAQGAVVP